MIKRIVCFGPGPLFKGGIANYNTSLAKALDALDSRIEVHIVSWTQQYPAIIPRDFIDRKSKSDQLQGTRIHVHYITNYNNPYTWYKTYKLIKNLYPDQVIFQWAIAIQGIPLSFIASKLKRHKNIEVIFDLHFVLQKEGSSIDAFLTRMAISKADTFIVHALKTANELKALFPKKEFDIVDRNKKLVNDVNLKQVIKLYHPVYDMFKLDPVFDIQEQKRRLGLKKHVFLFFGFIRKYKGLHNVIESFAKLAKERDDVSLLIVGEAFWNTLDNKKFSTRLKSVLFGLAKKIFLRKKDDEQDYRPLDLIAKHNLGNSVVSIIDFVPNEDVHKYFQVADANILFYLTATPSGVESISYNFKLPVIATRVGHFPETIKDGYNGYLAEPNNLDSMADAMRRFIEKPINRDHVAATSSEMSWSNYAKAILK